MSIFYYRVLVRKDTKEPWLVQVDENPIDDTKIHRQEEPNEDGELVEVEFDEWNGIYSAATFPQPRELLDALQEAGPLPDDTTPPKIAKSKESKFGNFALVEKNTNPRAADRKGKSVELDVDKIADKSIRDKISHKVRKRKG